MTTLRISIRDERGITLVEVLLYIALSVIMVGVLGSIAVNIIAVKVKARAMDEVGYNAVFILERIRNAVRSADSVTAPAGGVTAPSLELAMSDSAKDPTVISLEDGRVLMREGTGTSTPLSTSGVTVSNLTFSDVSYANDPGTLDVAVTVRAQNGGSGRAYDASTTLSTTIGLRTTP